MKKNVNIIDQRSLTDNEKRYISRMYGLNQKLTFIQNFLLMIVIILPIGLSIFLFRFHGGFLLFCLFSIPGGVAAYQHYLRGSASPFRLETVQVHRVCGRVDLEFHEEIKWKHPGRGRVYYHTIGTIPFMMPDHWKRQPSKYQNNSTAEFMANPGRDGELEYPLILSLNQLNITADVDNGFLALKNYFLPGFLVLLSSTLYWLYGVLFYSSHLLSIDKVFNNGGGLFLWNHIKSLAAQYPHVFFFQYICLPVFIGSLIIVFIRFFKNRKIYKRINDYYCYLNRGLEKNDD